MSDETGMIRDALIDAAVKEERKRCANIVSMARNGQIDQDFRSILYRINKPETD